MNSKLILLIGAGVLLYLWYENQSSTTAAASTSGLPSDAVPVLGPSGAPLTSSGSYVFYGPSEGQVYTAATAPTSAQLSAGATYWATAAGQAVYKNLMGTASAPSAGTTSSAPTQPVGAGSEVPPAPTPAPTSSTLGEPATYTTPQGGQAPTPTTLAGLWTAIQAWAAADSSFTSSGGVISGLPDHWNFYVSYIWPSAPTGYTGAWPPDVGTVFPGVDVNTPMTASQFWAGMGAYLQTGGLSGLRGLAGLGALRNTFKVRAPGGWAA